MELQLRSGSLFLLVCGQLLPLYRQTDRVQHQIHRLLCAGFVGNDAVVIKVTNHGQIQYALLCVDVRNICYPFAVGPVRVKLAVEQVFIFVYLLAHLLPLPAAADLGQQTVFLHNPQDGLGIAVDALLFQHQPHPSVSVGVEAALPLLRDDSRKKRVFLRPAQTVDEIIVPAPGYLEKSAHDAHRILRSVTVYDMVFYCWLHLLV